MLGVTLALGSGPGCDQEPEEPSFGAGVVRADSPPESGGSLSFSDRLELFYDREPEPDPESVLWTPLPGAEGFDRWDLTFRRWDGEKVTARLTRPAGTTEEVPLFVYLHRGIEDRSAADDLARLVEPLRGAVLTPDSPHRRRKTLVRGRKELREQILLVRDAVLDARFALSITLERGGFDGSRIVALGASLGSTPAVLLGGMEPRIRGVASLVGGVAEASSVLSGLVIPERKLTVVRDLLDPVDPAHLVERLAPRPFLMINAEEDELLPRTRAEALFERAGEPKEIHWRSGGHRFSLQAVEPILLPWLKRLVERE